MGLLGLFFLLYLVLCATLVTAYFEVTIFIRTGNLWKPRMEGWLVGFALSVLTYLVLASLGSGESAIFAPLFAGAAAVAALLAGPMVGGIYRTHGRAIFLKAGLLKFR